ncbi:class I SAM-dependent methyltransferase [Acinetobacter johnsonii]|uniref:class I SAM-dependent methyltransferase n=1 Tax=Acinetobacter johnsonii TaxID=40214 RepID=UPI00244A1DEA|nr:class I SAM-dependent methyltransferase [Acinetobacter johnsonii]MDH1519426.1 class I SAM-dependent methyltransferase [Acinetobacter johnsonii]
MLYKYYQQHIFPHVLNQVMQVPSLMGKRRELLLPIQGEVLEIGFGTGLNLPFYQNVDTVFALEPSPEIYHLALDRVQAAAFEVHHVQARAEKLPFADHSLEHVVSTWTLCSIAELELALAEILRVLKPGGTLHVVEHVLNTNNLYIQRLQHLLTPVQKRLADGCHLNRNIEQALKAAGFNLIEQHYFYAEGIPKLGQLMFFARAQKPHSSDGS